MYVVRGYCTINHWSKDNEMIQTPLKEGEYIFMDSCVKHQLHIAMGVECFILNVEISLQPMDGDLSLQKLYVQSSAVQAFLTKQSAVLIGYDSTNTIHSILTSLHRQLQNGEDKAEKRIVQNLLLAQLVIELARQQGSLKEKHSGKYVEETLNYLSKHFEEDIKIQDIDHHVGVTSSHLQRLFKQKTGVTLVEKLNEIRIEKAKILLRVTNMPVLDIAVSVGFNSRQHFAHTFLLFNGVSPSTYRSNNGEYIYYKDTEE
jgi:AraC-like DNA-binding protein